MPGRSSRPQGHKATNLPVTPPYLQRRVEALAERGYSKPKWVGFCETMLAHGFTVSLYEARKTVSKYVTVSAPGMAPYKVRFSNHRPIRHREAAGDCDFFVGVNHNTVSTTEQAIEATLKHFGIEVTPCAS